MGTTAVIAIDGPAAAGKGTLARMLAAELGFAYLDSGSLYRATALALTESGGDPAREEDATAAAHAIDASMLYAPALRSEETGALASQIASYSGVREALLDFQREFAAHPPKGTRGAVIDGRDIGTVVCPRADLKLFVTATPEERARRRTLELEGRGEVADYDAILDAVKARDRADRERATSPLVQADDAILLDTTEMGIEKVFEAALALIHARLSV